MKLAMNTKQRIIEQHKYNPMFPKLTERETRIIAANGANQTFKHPGDYIMPTLGKTQEVKNFGWY